MSWGADHADRHPRIQMGKTIDVSAGDGQRILAECLERAARLRPEAEPLATELRRFGVSQVMQPRLGQGTFRIAVTSAYGACAVSGEHSLPALEAAHVRPYADAAQRPAAARRHPLPRATPVTSPSRRTTASASAMTSPTTSAGGREYERFAGRAIAVPTSMLDQPDPELLDWHSSEVFRG